MTFKNYPLSQAFGVKTFIRWWVWHFHAFLKTHFFLWFQHEWHCLDATWWRQVATLLLLRVLHLLFCTRRHKQWVDIKRNKKRKCLSATLVLQLRYGDCGWHTEGSSGGGVGWWWWWFEGGKGGCYRPSVRIPVLAHPVLSISCLTAKKYPAPLQPKTLSSQHRQATAETESVRQYTDTKQLKT